MRRQLHSQSGATIIEVLIASVVFLIGFSLMVSFLSKTVDRVSFEDLYLATSVAEQQITLAERDNVASNIDTTVFQDGRRFLVSRLVKINEYNRSVSVTVRRPASTKVLIELYDEFPKTSH